MSRRDAEITDNEIVLARVLDAPREVVWKALTDAEYLARWFGPRGFSARVEELDLRVGGRARYVMIGPDGKEYPSTGTFLEIVRYERIVSTDEFGEDFSVPDLEDLPQGMVTTYTFEDRGGKTNLTVQISHSSVEDRRKHEEMGVVEGWHSTLDCLEEFLSELAGRKRPFGDSQGPPP